MANSNAPAGSTYRNVEHAGECILEVNANSFPDTNRNTMVPPKFVTKYPEPIDESTGEIAKPKRTLTKKEENRFTGMTRNACGEEAEYQAFKVFERLVQMENNLPLLIMRSYVIQNLKANVLAVELGINFDGIHTVAEFDAVVLVKDTGVILVEVKRQFTEDQQSKAENQLENGSLFFQRIMSCIAGSDCYLPIVKMIMFPDEESTSPTIRSNRDTHIFHKDLMANFNPKWKDLMTELDALKSGTSFSGNDFQRFARIVIGVWAMEKYQKRFYIFNSNEASSTYVLKQNDDMISRGIFSSDVIKAKNESKIVEPVTDIEFRGAQDSFPRFSGVDLIYLTPEQKDLYHIVPQAIINGSAGSGKTLLAYLKIIEILQNHSNRNILIIAPDPHHLRMEQFVKLNGGQTTVTETFPPSVSNGVVIMTLNDFFDVSRETLQSYDVNMYHVLIDDLQSLRFYNDFEATSTFSDVAEFIERSFANLIGSNQTFWCAVDVGQSEVIEVDQGYVSDLFNINRAAPRHLTIPIYTLNKILRNSVEIASVVEQIRELRVAKERASSRVLTKNTTGHRIRSESVTYHKLTNWTTTGDELGDWKKYGVDFVVERVEEELKNFFSPQNRNMNWKDIAILHNHFGRRIEEPLRIMLVSTFDITPQTIKEYITTNDDTIICDLAGNAASFECAFVIYLCWSNAISSYAHYNIMTRARTKLVVVDFDRLRKSPSLADDVIVIKWEEKDGRFCRV